MQVVYNLDCSKETVINYTRDKNLSWDQGQQASHGAETRMPVQEGPRATSCSSRAALAPLMSGSRSDCAIQLGMEPQAFEFEDSPV